MRRHLVIAGTGRAGTSFLVQYLTSCGFETHITRNPGENLDEHANAGLEDVPTEGADLPYVIKSPWFYEFVDDLLARSDVCIDAVILPMRDLVHAASSRVANELRARLGNESLPFELTKWKTWGATAGGIVYSLDPMDQARLLSMGFHQVVLACVKKQIPLIFLDFPRFISDGEYLYEQLQPVLKGKADLPTAMRAHEATARPDKVRIGAEIATPTVLAGGDSFPGLDALDRAALHREICNARAARDACIAESTRLKSMVDGLERALRENLVDQEQRTIQHDGEITMLHSAMEAARSEYLQKVKELSTARDAALAELAANRVQLSQIRTSTSWRITSPLRLLCTILRRKQAT